MTPIVYGFPGPEMWEAAERGEIELGGCVIGGDRAEHVCTTCGRQVGGDGEEIPRWQDMFPGK